MKHVERHVTVISLEDEGSGADQMILCQRLLEKVLIENLILKFGRRKLIDIGSLCYRDRWVKVRSVIKTVDPSTLMLERREPLQRLSSEIITLVFTRLSLDTCCAKLKDWKGFLTWSESNGHEDLLRCPDSYHRALKDFGSCLRRDKRAENTKSRIQSVCFELGAIFFPSHSVTDFRKGVAICCIPSVGGTGIPRDVPESDAVGRFVSICESLFVGISDFLLKDKRFPYAMPFLSGSIWLTVAEYPFVSELVLDLGLPRTGACMTFNYSIGKFREWDDFASRSSMTISKKEKYYQRKLHDYEADNYAANNDLRHERRMRLARYAHDCFLAMFVAISGMNESPVRNMPWSKDIKILSGEKGLRTVKIRALNKVVTFTIRAGFDKYLKRFLKLREYVCGGTEFGLFFFTMPLMGQRHLRKLDENRLIGLHRFLVGLVDPSLPKISYQDFRNYKDSFLAKSHGAEAARILLQHSEKTQRKNYLKANEKTAIDQIVDFFGYALVFFSEPHPLETPTGGCDKDCAPVIATEIQIPVELTPNCKDLMGCLFCKKFRLHADITDARKLVSLEFVTKEMIHACKDIVHFNSVYSLVLSRISFFLEQMTLREPRMKTQLLEVRVEVFQNHQLTDYWQRHLERLVKIGVLK